MSTDEDKASTPAARLIFTTRERMQMIRNRFHAERVRGGVTDETHRDLATAALQYRDVLSEHAEESVVREQWEQSGVDGLERLVGETQQIGVEAPGRTSNTQTVTQPAVLAVPAEEIYLATKALDSLAKELGFAAATRERTPEDNGDEQDLARILGGRGQAPSLERLPPVEQTDKPKTDG